MEGTSKTGMAIKMTTTTEVITENDIFKNSVFQALLSSLDYGYEKQSYGGYKEKEYGYKQDGYGYDDQGNLLVIFRLCCSIFYVNFIFLRVRIQSKGIRIPTKWLR